MHLAPIVIPTAFKFDAVRRFAFRTVSQTTINYRGSPLSRGSAGSVQGGDRLPWVQADGSDNFAPLTAIAWQVHVYGAAKPAVTAWCEQRGVPLHVFPWQAEYEAAGFARDALYLLRPDTYVAMADANGSGMRSDALGSTVLFGQDSVRHIKSAALIREDLRLTSARFNPAA